MGQQGPLGWDLVLFPVMTDSYSDKGPCVTLSLKLFRKAEPDPENSEVKTSNTVTLVPLGVAHRQYLLSCIPLGRCVRACQYVIRG